MVAACHCCSLDAPHLPRRGATPAHLSKPASTRRQRCTANSLCVCCCCCSNTDNVNTRCFACLMCWVCVTSRLRGSILVARRRRRQLTALRMRRKRSISRRLDRPLKNTTAASHHRDSTVGTRNSENSKLTSKNSCIKFALKSTYILCRTFNENLLAC